MMLNALIRSFLRYTRDERGFATWMFAISMPVLLGVSSLVVDSGHAFVERRELQNAADAAALAAASYLPSTNASVLNDARNAAIAVAAANGFTIGAADVEFSTDSEPYDVVTVRTTSDVAFFFAPVLSLEFAAVGSNAAAQLGSMVGGVGVQPWGVEPPPSGFAFGETYCLKLGSNGGGGQCALAAQGNFHALDIDDEGNSSANIYKDLIISGSQTLVTVGQTKNVVTGNMVGPTQSGTGCTGNSGLISGNSQSFDDVIEEDPNGGYHVLDWTSPRIVILPVVHFPNNAIAVIEGFAVFFISSCGNNGAVMGQFIDTVVPGGVWGSYNAAYGTRAIKLVN